MALMRQPFLLLPWQKHVLGEILGRCKPDGTRQYRQAYIEIPKKNGKSTLLSGIALYTLLADSEPGAEIYGAASDREQAGIIYRDRAYAAVGRIDWPEGFCRRDIGWRAIARENGE